MVILVKKGILSLSRLLSGLLCCFLFTGAYAQQSIFYEQGFEGSSFPPEGWSRTSIIGNNQWERSTDEARFGQASAYISYADPSGEDWLISPAFTVSAGDELSFYIRTDFSGYTPDELSVRVSSTGTLIANFTDEILNLKEGVNYPAEDTWDNHTLSLSAYEGETIHIAFRNTNENGDGVYIDQVALGTRPQVDIEVMSIEVEGPIAATTLEPKVTVSNRGIQNQPFTVRLEAEGNYISTRTVDALATHEMETVTFDSWTPEPGIKTLTATVELASDEISDNNTLSKSVTVLKTFPNQGWVSEDPLPGSKWASAVVGYTTTEAGPNNQLLVLAGNNGSGPTVSEVLSFDPETGDWSSLTSVPGAVQQAQAFFAEGKIFLIGGYSLSFSPKPSNNVQIYDIATDSWSFGSNMLVAVGDYAAAQYRESLLYIIGGHDGSGDVNHVQVYNTQTNEWYMATPFPGTPVAGMRGGIARGKLVVAGGYNQQTSAQTKQAYVGEIGTEFTSINWYAIQDYPGGSLGRHAGVSLNRAWDPYVYFTGGDPTGTGNSAKADTWAFNVETQAWESGPTKPTAANNLMGFGTLEIDGVTYLATVGGYDGTNFLAVNEWLALGSTTPTTDFSIIPEGNIHPIEGRIIGGGDGCNIQSSASIAPEALASELPANVSFPYDLLELNLQYCDDGATVTVELTFPESLADNSQYWKYGLIPGTETAESGWYTIPLTINGNTATFELVDGGQGDNDGTANGFIQDPGGIGIFSANSGPDTGNSPVGIPTTQHWMLILMSLLLGGGGLKRLRYR